MKEEGCQRCSYEWVNPGGLLQCVRCKSKHFVAITNVDRRERLLDELEALGLLGPRVLQARAESRSCVTGQNRAKFYEREHQNGDPDRKPAQRDSPRGRG